MKKFIAFFKTKIFVKNFIFVFLLMCGIIFISFFLIGYCTNHGEEFDTPNFIGVKISELDDFADDNDIEYEIMDSVFRKDLPKGTVVEQYPYSGFKIKKNRKIFLVVNAISAEKIVMPNLVGLTYRLAKMKLEAFGLKVGKITYSPDIAENEVLEQYYQGKTIEASVLIEKGKSIDLVLGDGLEKDNVFLPSLVGLTLEEARKVLIDAYLNVGMLTFDESVYTKLDSANAIIYKQYPAAENDTTKVKMSEGIDLWLKIR